MSPIQPSGIPGELPTTALLRVVLAARRVDVWTVREFRRALQRAVWADRHGEVCDV